MKTDDQEHLLNKMREIALSNPDNIRIIETSVDAEIQIEFFELLQSVENEENLPDPNLLFSQLNDSSIALSEKKLILARLTSYGEVESYRLLENYLKDPQPELKTWAYIAYQQARMFLESNLLEESKIYIASGLGGKDHRLRYIFAFSTKEGSFTDSQKNIIKGEIEYHLKKNEGLMEEISFVDNFVMCTIIIAIYINLVELLQDVVGEINQYGDFLKENVFITNEKRITSKDLDSIFNANDDSEYIPDKD